ncbi:hypothetical protein SKAU_G00295430 [Synaphobranchus kaupii]|uniref:Uncharacterized protein n=1 Tax=Synaphobranchus kaupii TaxID=118154 RepID=A0A9Q1EUQ9_SYNKA|nr:hypothetical protein SKAU_G00295430 [Synaphobranchus kaupii]
MTLVVTHDERAHCVETSRRPATEDTQGHTRHPLARRWRVDVSFRREVQRNAGTCCACPRRSKNGERS